MDADPKSMTSPPTPPAFHAATCSLPLTDRQLKIALNAVHERGMRLLNLWGDTMHKDFRKPDGKPPTKDERDELYAIHLEHLELVEAIRKIRAENAQADL